MTAVTPGEVTSPVSSTGHGPRENPPALVGIVTSSLHPDGGISNSDWFRLGGVTKFLPKHFYVKFLEDKSSFRGATDTPILDFW